jgi:hypothetical protein
LWFLGIRKYLSVAVNVIHASNMCKTETVKMMAKVLIPVFGKKPNFWLMCFGTVICMVFEKAQYFSPPYSRLFYYLVFMLTERTL